MSKSFGKYAFLDSLNKNQKDGIRVTMPFHGSKILHPKIIKQILADLKMNLEGL